MKTKNFLNLILLLASTISSAQSISPTQLLRRTSKSLDRIQTLVYKIHFTQKDFTSKDTITRVALCSLYMAPKDKIGMYYIIDNLENKDENSYYTIGYDGEYTSHVSYRKDDVITLKKNAVRNVKDSNYGYVRTTMLCTTLFNKKESFATFKSFFERLSIKRIEVKETIHSGVAVYALTVFGKANEKKINRVKNAVDVYYIRKSDYLPIAHSFYGYVENMEGYEYTTIEYVAINPNLPLEIFKIDPNPKTIDTAILYNNVLKHQL